MSKDSLNAFVGSLAVALLCCTVPAGRRAHADGRSDSTRDVVVTPLAAGGASVAVASPTAVAFPGHPPAGFDETWLPWREMHLSADRRAGLTDELTRALKNRWRRRLLDIDVGLVNPRVLTDGRAFHLLADGGRIDVKDGTIGDLPITGSIELDRLAVDYAQLGLGRIRVVGDTRVKPTVVIDLDQVDRLLKNTGFVDTEVRWNDESRRFTIVGTHPVRLLLFNLRPRFRISGRFHVENEYLLRLDRVRIDVSGVLGFFARLALSRMERRCAQCIDLREDYARLRAVSGIVISGGTAELRGPTGVIKRIEFPPDPTIDH